MSHLLPSPPHICFEHLDLCLFNSVWVWNALGKIIGQCNLFKVWKLNYIYNILSVVRNPLCSIPNSYQEDPVLKKYPGDEFLKHCLNSFLTDFFPFTNHYHCLSKFLVRKEALRNSLKKKKRVSELSNGVTGKL